MIDQNIVRTQANKSLYWLNKNLDRFRPMIDPNNTISIQAFSEFTLLFSYLQEWNHD